MVNKITTPPTQNEVISKVNELVDDKQDTLVSGTNIKTINNTSILSLEFSSVARSTVEKTANGNTGTVNHNYQQFRLNLGLFVHLEGKLQRQYLL